MSKNQTNFGPITLTIVKETALGRAFGLLQHPENDAYWATPNRGSEGNHRHFAESWDAAIDVALANGLDIANTDDDLNPMCVLDEVVTYVLVPA